jgi:arabinan endo-1,5-alpha-L-arabinosidase
MSKGVTLGLWLLAGAALSAAAPADDEPLLAAQGSCRIPVHDPSTVIRCGDEFWVYGTGPGLTSRHSTDLVHWQFGPAVFARPPAWTAAAVPGNTGVFWAPDILRLDGRYLLYYAVSTLGSRHSVIALATNTTLDPNDPAYGWHDEGIVERTTEANNYNAIDPSLLHAADGRLWLCFGSFWSGIKLVELDPKTGRRLDPNARPRGLAWHSSIEAACLWQHGEWYYLWVNWGACCKGVDSTYEIRVGRSHEVGGPYLDRDGHDMLRDGGSLFLGTSGPFIGPGHAGILEDGGKLWFSCHFYDRTHGGRGTLAVRPMTIDADGWPVLDPKG